MKYDEAAQTERLLVLILLYCIWNSKR